MWFKRTRIAYLALIVSVLTLSVTGIVAASTGRFNPSFEKMNLRMDAAVDSGELTRDQADKIRK